MRNSGEFRYENLSSVAESPTHSALMPIRFIHSHRRLLTADDLPGVGDAASPIFGLILERGLGEMLIPIVRSWFHLGHFVAGVPLQPPLPVDLVRVEAKVQLEGQITTIPD